MIQVPHFPPTSIASPPSTTFSSAVSMPGSWVLVTCTSVSELILWKNSLELGPPSRAAAETCRAGSSECARAASPTCWSQARVAELMQAIATSAATLELRLL